MASLARFSAFKDYSTLSAIGTDTLRDCTVAFSCKLNNASYMLEYVQSGGAFNQGYLQIQNVRGTENLSTRFILRYANAVDKQRAGYIIIPVQNQDVHLCVTQGEGWQQTSFGEPWTRSNIQMKIAGFTTEKDTKLLQVTMSHYHDGKDYKLRVAGASSGSRIGADNNGGGTPTPFAVNFIKASPAVWKLLLQNPKARAFCCDQSQNKQSVDEGLQAACSAEGLGTADSKDCSDLMASSCKDIGFDDSACFTWCTKNPGSCNKLLMDWCSRDANKKKDVCKCFDTNGFSEFTKKMQESCASSGYCQQSAFSPGCYYPPCIASGMANVAQAGNACPNNIVAYNKCLIDVKVEDGSTITGDMIANCIQQGKASTTDDPSSGDPAGIAKRKIPTIKYTDGSVDKPVEPPPDVKDDKDDDPLPDDDGEEPDFWKQWWWVFLVGGIGGLLILGLFMWLVFKS